MSRNNGCRTAPGEPGLDKAGFDLRSSGCGRAFVNDARPFRYQIEQHGALLFVHGGSVQALGILPWSEHQIGYLVIQDRLLSLGFVKGVQQSESLIVLSERSHRFPAC